MKSLSNKLNFWIPLTIEKSVNEKTGKKELIFQGIASDNSIDSQNEILEPSGFQIDEFLKSGFINYWHKMRDTPKSIVGEPLEASIVDNKFIIKGKLYENSKLACDIYETAEMLEKAKSNRRLGFSVEGIPLARDPLNSKRITKARISSVAITPVPINRNTIFNLVKGEQEQDYIDYEFEKSDANGSMSPEYLVDITDKDKGVRVTMDKSLTIKIEKSMTTSSSSGKAMIKESLEKKPKNLFEFQKAVVTISKGHELGMVPDDMIEKARMHKYLRKEGDRYIYEEKKDKNLHGGGVYSDTRGQESPGGVYSSKEESKEKKKDKKKLPEKNTPEWHKLQIAKDTVKNPLKGMFLGGPTVEEAKKTLKEYGLL